MAGLQRLRKVGRGWRLGKRSALIDRYVLAALQRGALAAPVDAFNCAVVDANLFGAFRVHAKAGISLAADPILSFRSLNYVLCVLALLLSAHQHLTAIDD